jgi:putative ABC transport system permease protein
MRLIFDIFAQTLRTLWAHKLRSFLTMFGIAWGVGSWRLRGGLGEGFRSGNRKQFDELGENVMFVWGGRAPAMNGSFTSMRQYYLTYKDYQDILTDCPDVKAASPVIQRSDIRSVSEFYQSSGQLNGVLADYSQIRYMPMTDGRWINELDDAEKRQVIVLGDEARRVLFPGRPSIGSIVLLNGVEFQVIGTLKRLGHGDNNTRNLQVYIPFHHERILSPAQCRRGH